MAFSLGRVDALQRSFSRPVYIHATGIRSFYDCKMPSIGAKNTLHIRAILTAENCTVSGQGEFKVVDELEKGAAENSLGSAVIDTGT